MDRVWQPFAPQAIAPQYKTCHLITEGMLASRLQGHDTDTFLNTACHMKCFFSK